MVENINNKEKLKNEINKLVLNEWDFLNDNWKNISFTYKHRTEIKNIKEINNIKKEVLDKLGYISVFFFLTKLYAYKEYPAPYIEIEKGIYLIYHLTSKNIKKNIPYASF